MSNENIVTAELPINLTTLDNRASIVICSDETGLVEHWISLDNIVYAHRYENKLELRFNSGEPIRLSFGGWSEVDWADFWLILRRDLQAPDAIPRVPIGQREGDPAG